MSSLSSQLTQLQGTGWLNGVARMPECRPLLPVLAYSTTASCFPFTSDAGADPLGSLFWNFPSAVSNSVCIFQAVIIRDLHWRRSLIHKRDTRGSLPWQDMYICVLIPVYHQDHTNSIISSSQINTPCSACCVYVTYLYIDVVKGMHFRTAHTI